MLSRRRRAKLPDSWSSYASNMERRIGSGRHPLQLLDVEYEEARQAARQLEQLRLKYGEEN
jgi:hypothetical protein